VAQRETSEEISFMRSVFRLWMLCALLGLALSACGSGEPEAGAARAVEAYLQARVQANLDQLTLLSCPEWEGQARIEATAFQSMKAQLEGVTCQANGSEGSFTLVACQGKIVTNYQGEAREWSVADHPYKVIQQDGEWRMCGYGA
jgi:hypothetical protein